MLRIASATPSTSGLLSPPEARAGGIDFTGPLELNLRISYLWAVEVVMAKKPAGRNFMLLFRGGSNPSGKSPEEMERVMQSWHRWMGRLTRRHQLKQGHPLDGGGRVLSGRKGRIVKPVTESANSIGGCLLIHARSLRDAQKIARDCPILERGGSVEIRPVLPA